MRFQDFVMDNRDIEKLIKELDLDLVWAEDDLVDSEQDVANTELEDEEGLI